MRITDIQLSFPATLLAIFIMTVFGRGVDKVIVALVLVGWVRYARTVREVLRENQRIRRCKQDNRIV